MEEQTIIYILIILLVIFIILFIVINKYVTRVGLYDMLILYIILAFLILAYYNSEKLNNQQFDYKPSIHSVNNTNNTTQDFTKIDITKIDPENYGIGGLDKEIKDLFRSVLFTRLLPKDQFKLSKLRHVKGCILHGPPGTGKTTVVRALANIIGTKNLTFVKGPEIYNKYVGQSEENIRSLFNPAKNDYRLYGDKSPLHIICIDEIDSLTTKRGSNFGSGVDDKVLNQLLTEMDGLEEYDNFIIFGTTNRLDMLDEAILRPGRFDVKIKIGRPNLIARKSIIKVQLDGMHKANMLSNDININKIAELTEHYTGADISGVVKNAFSRASKRYIENKESIKITMDDILLSLKEIKPIIGAKEKRELELEKSENTTNANDADNNNDADAINNDFLNDLLNNYKNLSDIDELPDFGNIKYKN